LEIERILSGIPQSDQNSEGGSLHRNLWVKSLQRNALQGCHTKHLKMSNSDTEAARIFNSISEPRMTRAKVAVMLIRSMELSFYHRFSCR